MGYGNFGGFAKTFSDFSVMAMADAVWGQLCLMKMLPTILESTPQWLAGERLHSGAHSRGKSTAPCY